MKKISTVYLLGALVMLGSCARQYPVFNQMPTNAYLDYNAKTSEKQVAKAEVAEVAKSEEAQVTNLEPLMANPRVSEMLAENSPKQLDEQLETALATTQGQKLMAKPAIAAKINKVRTMLTNDEFQKVNLANVQTAQVNKMVDKSIKKSMQPEAAKALTGKIKIGLILILAGIVLGLIPGIGWTLGSIVGAIGVVFIVLGLIDNV